LDKNNDPQEILDYLKTKLISYEEHQKDYEPIPKFDEKNAT